MIIKTKKDEFQSYLEDTSNLEGKASALYLAGDSKEIKDILINLSAKKIPFTVSAGRTGTTGGCVPAGGVIVSIENLKKIIDIDKNKKIAHLETGVNFNELETAAGKFNLTLLASPTESLAFVGGAISTCASGVRGFGYGSIRNYIKAISVILPAGQVLEIERGQITSNKRVFDFELSGKKFKFNAPSYRQPQIKSQAGYFVEDNMDLIDLFIGSEGTLGVITSCKIMLQQKPDNIFDGLIFFEKETECLEFVKNIKKFKDKGTLNPASIEFFDSNSLQLLKGVYSFIPKAEAALYFEQTVDVEENYDILMGKWLSIMESSETLGNYNILADTQKEREKLFEIRHKVPELINEFLRQHKQLKSSVDCAVPFDKFLEMYKFYKDKAKESKINYVNFGHIGQAHLHFNFMPNNADESIKAKEYIETFCKKAVSLSGTVSAEHGIGKIKKPYLKIMYNERQIKEMAHVKKYFDPACLMGLDNIFEKELLPAV